MTHRPPTYTTSIVKVFRLKTMQTYYTWTVSRGDWRIVSGNAPTEREAQEAADSWIAAIEHKVNRLCEITGARRDA